MTREKFTTILPPPIIYDYVDLDLPSGTKWATTNVGARKASDAGLYFQWGDTQGYTAAQVGTSKGKKEFSSDWSDYKWNPSGDGETFTKYTIAGTTLDLDDDAAYANMGGDWHMPSPTQLSELINTSNTTSAWTTLDGVSGVTFTSKKDSSKSIFIPADGCALNGTVVNSGSYGSIWSSMLSVDNVSYGQYLSFTSYNVYLDIYGLYYGRCVRGVIG